MKKIFVLFLTLTGMLLFIFLFKSEIYRIFITPELTESQNKELYNLAFQAKTNGDLPISSLLLVKKKIIGEGYNTVVRDSDIYGHAEINAIKDAVSKIGLNAFMKMDRNELIIILHLNLVKCAKVFCFTIMSEMFIS